MSRLLGEVHEKALRLGIPWNVHLDLTWRCNLRCVHCYLVQREGPELKLEEVSRVLEELAACGTLFLCLSGGEVMLREDLFDIMERARRLNFYITVKTNGTMLEAEAVRRLAELNVARVDVSLYSHQPEIHDAVTQAPGSFARTMAAVRELTSRGVKVQISHVLMRQAAASYTEVRRLAAELGTTYKLDATITPRLDGNAGVLRLNVPDAIWREIYNDPELVGPLMPDSPRSAPSALAELPCSAGHTACYISPFGDVYPCVQFPLRLGNVREQSFEKIWRESPALLRWRAVRNADLVVCRTCELHNVCSRCPGLAYMEGDLLGPSRLDCEKAYARTGLRPAPWGGIRRA